MMAVQKISGRRNLTSALNREALRESCSPGSSSRDQGHEQPGTQGTIPAIEVPGTYPPVPNRSLPHARYALPPPSGGRSSRSRRAGPPAHTWRGPLSLSPGSAVPPGSRPALPSGTPPGARSLSRRGISTLSFEVDAVLLDVAGPLGGNIGIREDGLHGTLGFAGTAVDALIWMNVVLIVALVDAVHRADLDATRVLGPDAGLRDDVCHGSVRLTGEAPARLQAGRKGREDDAPKRDEGPDGRIWSGK